jgi:hypothetical protein
MGEIGRQRITFGRQRAFSPGVSLPVHSHPLNVGENCPICRGRFERARASASAWLAYLEHRYGFGCPVCNDHDDLAVDYGYTTLSTVWLESA